MLLIGRRIGGIHNPNNKTKRVLYARAPFEAPCASYQLKNYHLSWLSKGL